MKESYETDKYLYIVMEQVNGGELFEHIRTYDLDEKEVALIMNQLIEAISYMQMCGVVHRDLKPENILVEKDPRSDIVTVLKVADFGLLSADSCPSNLKIGKQHFIILEKEPQILIITNFTSFQERQKILFRKC